MQAFFERKKMGGVEYSQQYADKLRLDLDAQLADYLRQNEQKNVFRTAKTPTTLLISTLINYFVSSIFAFIGTLPPHVRFSID